MKYCVLTALLCLSVNVFGGPTTRIAGGSDAEANQYPYQVFLEHPEFGFLCSGSILNKRYILTSAPCLTLSLSPLEYNIVVGTIKRKGGNGTVYKVESYVTHEGYEIHPGSVGPVNDIALIRLTEDIKFSKSAQPVKLPESNLNTYENTSAILTGWGTVRMGGKSLINLQQIQLKVLDLRTCNETWFDFMEEIIYENKVCTTSKIGQGACQGDAGDPLVVNETQIGVFSYTWPCGAGVPDVFTRVSSYLDWIKKHIKV